MLQNMYSLLHTDSPWEKCRLLMRYIPYPWIKFGQNSTKTPDNFFISPSYQDKVQWNRRINIKRKPIKQTKKTNIGRSLKKKKTVKTLRQCPLFWYPKSIQFQILGAMLIPTVSNSECKIQLQKLCEVLYREKGTILGSCANFTGNLARIASVLFHSKYLWALSIWKVSLWCLQSTNTLMSFLPLLGCK